MPKLITTVVYTLLAMSLFLVVQGTRIRSIETEKLIIYKIFNQHSTTKFDDVDSQPIRIFVQLKDDDEDDDSTVITSDEDTDTESDTDTSDETVDDDTTDDSTDSESTDTTDDDSDDSDSEEDDDTDDESDELEIVIGYFGEEGYIDEDGVYKAFVTFEDYDLTIYKFISQDETTQSGEWFIEVDTDGDTYLSFEEFDTAIETTFGFNCYQSYLFFNIGDGIMGHGYRDYQLTLHEVQSLYSIYLYSPYYQQVEFLFLAADSDLDGYLTEDDFTNVTLAYGTTFDLVFEDVDVDDDDQISIYEFLVAFEVDLSTIPQDDDDSDDSTDEDSTDTDDESDSSDSSTDSTDTDDSDTEDVEDTSDESTVDENL